MSLVKHEKRKKKSWIHTKCGCEVVRESIGSEFCLTRTRSDKPVLERYENQSGYKCIVCGFIPESEVKEGVLEEETWEW